MTSTPRQHRSAERRRVNTCLSTSRRWVQGVSQNELHGMTCCPLTRSYEYSTVRGRPSGNVLLL